MHVYVVQVLRSYLENVIVEANTLERPVEIRSQQVNACWGTMLFRCMSCMLAREGSVQISNITHTKYKHTMPHNTTQYKATQPNPTQSKIIIFDPITP